MSRRRTVFQVGMIILAVVGIAYDCVRTERTAAADSPASTSATPKRLPGWAKAVKPRAPVETAAKPPTMQPCVAAQYAKLEATMAALRGSLTDDAFQARWAVEKAKLLSPVTLEALGCAF